MSPPPDQLLEQYKACREDIGRIGERYESSKNFYVTIISALFAFLALAGGDDAVFRMNHTFLWLVALVGVGVCMLWILHTRSVAALFRIKFHLLADMEEKGGLYPACQLESAWLFAPHSRPEKLKDLRYVSIGRVNTGIAVLFLVLFLILPFLKTVAG